MKEQVHKNEIIRLANSEQGTKIWFKIDHAEWKLALNASWEDWAEYIVNDRHAEIRKALIDNPDLEIEYLSKDKDKIWKPHIGKVSAFNVEYEYRIKPEIVKDDKESFNIRIDNMIAELTLLKMQS